MMMQRHSQIASVCVKHLKTVFVNLADLLFVDFFRGSEGELNLCFI